MLRPLRDPVLALLWVGQAASSIGDQLFVVALAWVAVRVFGANAGYLTVLEPVCLLLVALFAGRWADQVAPRVVMVGADLGRAAILAVVLAAWLLAGTPPAWTLVLAVVCLGAGAALFVPALQSSLPVLVDRESALPAANALMDTTARIARVLGPALVAILGSLLPLVHFVSLDVASFVASGAAVALTVRLRAMPDIAPDSAASWREPVLANLARGFRAMVRHPILGYAMFASSPTAGVWYASLFLGVPLALRNGPGGIGAYGTVLLGYGITNLLATLLMGGFAVPRRPAWVIFGGISILGAGFCAIGLALLLPQAWQASAMFAGAALGAIGGPMEDIPVAVLRQTRLARSDQAAAMRASLVVGYGGVLVALCGAPLLFARFGPAAVMVAGGVAVLLVGAFGWWRYAHADG